MKIPLPSFVLVLDDYFYRVKSSKSNCSIVVFPWFLNDPLLSLLGLLAVTLCFVISATALGFPASLQGIPYLFTFLPSIKLPLCCSHGAFYFAC